MRYVCLAELTRTSVFHYVASTDLFIRQMSSAKLELESSTSIHAMLPAMLAACQTTTRMDPANNMPPSQHARPKQLALKVLSSLYIAQAKTNKIE